MTVLSLQWKSPYLERLSLYWDRAQVSYMVKINNSCQYEHDVFKIDALQIL